VIDQAERIAARAISEADGQPDAAVALCFERLLGRPPTEDELTACQEEIRGGDLSLVCRALINSNEFAFLP
jgi:hypothetical protein